MQTLAAQAINAHMNVMSPHSMFERAAMRKGLNFVAGVDEVGRGPLAGPVTAAAVLLNWNDVPKGLNDSKKLTWEKRQELAGEIHRRADVSIAHASPSEIDDINILQASHLAMCRAVAGLGTCPDLVLIDGNLIPKNLTVSARAIVKGDARSLSIAAASIVAKVARDNLMVDLAQQYPVYGWDKNVGYATKAHLEGLKNHGATPHHRRSFKPVHNM